MVYTDPISDMLSRIRNAILVNKTTVEMPHSNLKEKVAKQLVASNFVDGVNASGKGTEKKLVIDINQVGTNARINTIEKISKPGRRAYAAAGDIPTVKNGRGLVIVSTSQGVMTGAEAKKKNIGGELMVRVY